MSVDMIARTIQLILAPVVMITACGLLVNGLLARYAALNDRLRALAHERLDLIAARGAGDGAAPARPLVKERLMEIDVQAPDLLRRHRLIHDSVLAVYAAIGLFIVSMFTIALAIAAAAEALATVALAIFLAGTAVVLLGVILTALEVRTSHRALHYEVRRVLSLT